MKIVGFADDGDAHAGSLDRLGCSWLACHSHFVPGGAECPGQRHHEEIVRRLAPGYEQHLHEPDLRSLAAVMGLPLVWLVVVVSWRMVSWRRVAATSAGTS